MKPSTQHTNIIIGGTSKAGTTSLFLYLADHPSVCGANSKETGFFLDDSYPRRAKYRLEDGEEHYDTYFNQCSDLLYRVDATPDYLYSSGAAGRIRSVLEDVKLLFILRDPIDRLVSWYRFSRQLARTQADLSFEEYISAQRSELPIKPGEQPYMRALQQGRYSQYLSSYFDQFPADNIQVRSFGALQDNPLEFMNSISHFVGIDPAFYRDYRFPVHNRTRTMRFAGLNGTYVRVRDQLRMRVNTQPFIKRTLQPVRRGFEAVFFRLNSTSDDDIRIPPELRSWLTDYYAEEVEHIAQLTGQDSFTW